uniref:DivIVA domain-containing protein n=1 Tax=Algoriphagus sp. TaxID=1872435 RepID=UPI0040480C8D
MKISPTAIRQKTFETSFRGFEKKQVASFLEEMSVAMEQVNQENLELRSRLQQVEAEAKRLKDVEDSLFRTLKTAEDTGAAIITEATEAADQIIAEANQIAEETSREAQNYAGNLEAYSKEQAQLITAAAEAKAKETMRELNESIKGLLRSYEGLVEQREALVKSLRRLSQDAMNQLDLSDSHFSRIDPKAYQRALEELSRSNYFSAANTDNLASVSQTIPVEPELVSEEFQDEVQQVEGAEEEMNPSEVKEETDLVGDHASHLDEEIASTFEDEYEVLEETAEEEVVLEEEAYQVDELLAEGEEVQEHEEEEHEEEEHEEEEHEEEDSSEEKVDEVNLHQEIQAESDSMQEAPPSEEIDEKKEIRGDNGAGSFFDQFD